MSAVAVAVVGSAVIGAAASSSASKQAAGSAKNQIKSTNALASQARTDAKDLYSGAGKSAQAGIGGAFNFYQQNAQKRNAPAIQGNMMAQGVLGQGAQQANNAILGLPVDMSFANTPQQVTADYSGINSAQMPILGASAPASAPASASVQPTAAPAKGQKSSSPLTLGGYAADPRTALNPMTAITNPLATLGFGDKITKKLDPVSNTKKLLKKIF